MDRQAYHQKWRLDGAALWPSWACKSPNGHIHKDNRVGAIDVHLSRLPNKKDEISWTCEFQVWLIAKAWLGLFEDLIDLEKTGIGRVFLGGEESTEWVTLHEANPPLVMMKEGWRQHCPICGADDNVIYKGKFFADPAVLERDVIVTGEGIFIREREVLLRGLPPPKGGYKPVRVAYRPEWMAKMRLMTPPDFSRL